MIIYGIKTHLWFYTGCQRLDDFMDRMCSRCWRTLLVLVPPARWSGYYSSSRRWVQSLTVWVLVQRSVPRLCLVLPHYEPRQRQVFDCGDRNPFAGLTDRLASHWFSGALMQFAWGLKYVHITPELWGIISPSCLVDFRSYLLLMSRVFVLKPLSVIMPSLYFTFPSILSVKG